MLKTICTLILLATLTACGGGGGTDEEPGARPVQPFETCAPCVQPQQGQQK